LTQICKILQEAQCTTDSFPLPSKIMKLEKKVMVTCNWEQQVCLLCKKKTETALIWECFVLPTFIVSSINSSNNLFSYDVKKAFLTNWKGLALQIPVLNGAFIIYQKEKWRRKNYCVLFLERNYNLWWNIFVWTL